MGIAVDASGNLYVANMGAGNVLVYSGETVTTLAPAGVTTPVGVAVEPSGSVLIADKSTGTIVRVPNEAGTLTSADAVVIATNPKSASGVALDVAGNLYTTDATGAAAYAVQQTASAINFGSVNAGSSSAASTIYVENAGNTALSSKHSDTQCSVLHSVHPGGRLANRVRGWLHNQFGSGLRVLGDVLAGCWRVGSL